MAIAVAIALPALAQNVTPTSQKAGAVLLTLPSPTYPPQARIARVQGEVRVIVTVKPDGESNASVEAGIPLLNQAALDSAEQSHFECPGCTIPTLYVLVYAFEFERAEDCKCDVASTTPVHVTRFPSSTDDQGRPQVRVVISTAALCICDPAEEIIRRRARAAKCLYLWRCGWK